METRDGVIEFRTVQVPITVSERHKTRTEFRGVLEYRQCFKGIWTEWKPVQPTP